VVWRLRGLHIKERVYCKESANFGVVKAEAHCKVVAFFVSLLSKLANSVFLISIFQFIKYICLYQLFLFKLIKNIYKINSFILQKWKDYYVAISTWIYNWQQWQ
jgi:hypothetical protein